MKSLSRLLFGEVFMRPGWLSRTAPILFLSLILLVLGTPCGFAREAAHDPSTAHEDKPIVRVLTPGAVSGSSDPSFGGAAFLMGQWGGTRVLIAIEIVDVTGAGIDSTDSGEIRFHEASKNVDLFADRIEQQGTYTDGQGRSVIQLVSRVPIENLETGDQFLTPPLDKASIPARLLTDGFSLPREAMLEAIEFLFIVEDRDGVRSDPTRLVIAHADDYFRGPFIPVEKSLQDDGADPKQGD